jgi:T-complex protein 1 subunit theta
VFVRIRIKKLVPWPDKLAIHVTFLTDEILFVNVQTAGIDHFVDRMASKGPSFSGFYKDGTRNFKGTDEVVLRTVEMVHDFASMSRTSIGPNGMKKIIQNHFGKLFVTGDASTMIEQAEVQHVGAKMLANAAKMQAEQVGDGTNLVVVFGGELLHLAAGLIEAGIHIRDIVTGYERGLAKALEIIKTLHTKAIHYDLNDTASVVAALKTPLSSHQFLDADHLAALSAAACLNAYPNRKGKFSVDNVRTVKALGGSVSDSYFVRGFAVQREVMGTIRRMTDCHLAVFATSFDLPESDTKMQTVFKSGAELQNYSLTQEQRMGELVSSIAVKGVNVVVCQSKITELALHYLEKHGILALQLPSNYDIRRLCRAVGATPLLRISSPTPEEIGSCPLVECQEVGSTALVVFEAGGGISTIVVRGATPNVIDDVERSLDDATNSFLVMTEFPQLVPGAGACEMEVAVQLARWADTLPGMDQYGVRKFAEAFEVVPRTIAENSGLRIADFMAKLRAAHSKPGGQNAGVDVLELAVGDAEKMGVFDIAHIKEWAVKLATDVATTLLRINQIVVAKAAGGPAPRAPGARDAD